jgi:AcrR family transcriptional regulator
MLELPDKKSARRQPKQRRSLETIQVVLEGAVKVLGREGVDAVTTNRIAEAAGVSIGSLYQYFPDKHAIFSALHVAHAQRVRQLLERIVSSHATCSLESLILAILDSLIDEHSADPRELHELLSLQPQEGGLRHALASILESRDPALGPCPRGTQFVIPSMIDVLVHETVLSRPGDLSLAAAKEEAARAVVGYLRA